jgi:altronate dehydratase small subunit
MMNPVNSILISEKDNVATALKKLRRGDVGRYLFEGKTVEIVIVEAIPQYHKFAICNIQKNEAVRKYGEAIGQAAASISAGAHVHTHNIISPGRVDP